MTQASFIGILVIFVLGWIYIFSLSTREVAPHDQVELAALSEQMNVLRRLLAHEQRELTRVKESLRKMKQQQLEDSSPDRAWKDPIPILVFACNRPVAVKNHVDKLIRLRPSAERFPIIVTQDCDNEPVRQVIETYGDKVQYIKHISGEKANISIPHKHATYVAYYRISRHYKLALDYVFEKRGYTSVVITEDDLDLATDFFEYFSATRYLLDDDPLLWCVSAWNDNGKMGNIDQTARAKLYRSDFFPGLGWMMSSTLWKELGPMWPPGFWDDWMRDPLRRKGRQCIRPEISRTGMSDEGKQGASKGQFFAKHLAKIVINRHTVNFTRTNLDYLLQSQYDPLFEKEVFSNSRLLSIDEAGSYTLDGRNRNTSIRIEYNGNVDYIRKADKLHIMHDFKAGVPRTAYKGVVSCFVNGVRIYLVPDRNVIKGYDSTWEVPNQFGE